MNRQPTRQAGFTLMEVMFALVSLGLIGAALTAMLVAAGDAWTTRDDYRRQIADARGVMANVTEWVRSGRRVISAPVTDNQRYHNLVVWHNDNQYIGEVNLSEIRVITYDAQLETLTLYAAPLTDAQKVGSANVALTPATVGAASFPASFRTRTGVGAYPLAEDVSDFTVTLVPPAENEPSYRLVELRMELAGPDGMPPQLELTTAFTRAPDYNVDFDN
jgi:type II secretory pathway pseudopilin PulG